MTSLESICESLIYTLYEEGELSPKLIRDRHYAFWQLYECRTVMLELICNCLAYKCFKTKKHFDGTMFNGDFILGIDTNLGVSTHHIKALYFDDFHVPEIDFSPKYDGYTPEDNLSRLGSIVLPKKYFETDESIPYKPFPLAINEHSERIALLVNNLLEELRERNKINLGGISDGHHSFELIYRQIRLLTNILCQLYKDFAYKSKFDINGDPIPDDKFFVGINTPEGEAIKVFNGPRFNEFDLPILETAPISMESIITRDHELLDVIHQDFIKKILSLKIRKYHE